MRTDEFDSLYSLPLAEFTSARNALAGRLKKSGKSDEAEQVKTLAKPSVSAWAVNQLYWKHRNAFDRLLATGRALRHGQFGEKSAMREQAEARRDALSELLRLADALLRESGHNPTSDTMRRISTTLEALSAYASVPNAPVPGRLSEDLAPTGFEALSGLIVRPETTKIAPAAPEKPRKSGQRELVAAKRAVDQAEAALKHAQARAKKIDAEHREAEQRAKRIAAEAETAAQEVEKAKRVMDQASKALADVRRES